MSGKTFIDHFSALEDPRQAWKVVYPLPEILLLVLCGTLAGAEDFVEIARWGRRKLEFLRRLLPFARGIASHDTLNDVMNALPARAVRRVLHRLGGEPARARRPTSSRSTARPRGGQGRSASDPLHLVSAWASRQRLVLGQDDVAEKTNEIIAIPLLLERLELAGALVTLDAMGCQRAIAETIRDKRADYLCALKDNWPALAEEVRLYFDTAPAGALATHADHRRRPRPHRDPPRLSSATTSAGSPPIGASPASGASRTSR